MAIDISGADGSLFFKAGVDTSDFDKAIQGMTNEIQASLQKQIQIQEQAAGSQKLITEQILASAGLIKGMDKDIESQLTNLTALQQHIQSLKGESLQLNAKGFDTTELTTSLDTVLTEIEKIKSTPLDLQSGKVDVAPLLQALSSVQAAFDKVSGQTLQLKVSGINTESVEKAFLGLQGKIENLNQTALDLKVKGVDTTSLTAAIEKAKSEFETLKGLTLTASADLDITEFQKQYDALQSSLTKLEGEKIELKAQGIDTTQIEKDLTTIRTQAASIQRNVLKISVDDSSLTTLETHLQTLKAQSLDFKAKGVDTTALDASLLKVQEKIEQIKAQPVELRTGTVNLAPLSTALTGVQKQVDQISNSEGLQVFAKNGAAAFESVNEAIDQSEQDLKDYLKALDELKKEGVEVKVNQRAPDSPKVVAAQQGNLPLDEANLKTLADAKAVLEDMDKPTQRFIQDLVKLEGQLEAVKVAQKDLDAERAKGNITAKQYTQATQALAAQEKLIADSISLVGKRQKDYEKSLEPVIEKTVSAQARLSQLKKEMASNPSSPLFEGWKQEAVELQLSIDKVNQELKNTVALQGLQNRRADIQGLLATEQDTSKVKALKTELSQIDVQIGKLGNAGKVGFDEVGNAIEKTSGKTNLLSKGFSFIRQAAFLIPGIGLAGIFNLIGEAVISLVASLFKGKVAFDEIREKIKLFTEVNAEASRQAASQITDLKLLYKAATDVNASMEKRLDAVKGLKAEFPDTFANLRNEIILNGQAKTSYEELSKAIVDNAKAKAAKDKIDQIEAQRLEIAFQKQKIVNATENETAAVKGDKVVKKIVDQRSDNAGLNETITITAEQQKAQIAARRKNALDEQDIQDKRLENQEKFLTQFAGGEKKVAEVIEGGNKKIIEGSVEAIDAQIADQKKLQSHFSTTSKQYQDYQKTINDLEEKRKNIVGASKVNDSEQNKGLSQRLQLLKDIQALQRESTQSGLIKEASEIDKINEKYDVAIQKIKEFNASKAVLAGKVAPINTDQIDALNQARSVEVDNTIQKQQAEEFKKSLEDQKAIFDDFEAYKKEAGIGNAEAVFREQTKGFDSYIDLLKSQIQELKNDTSIGGQIKFKFVLETLNQAEKDKAKKDFEDQAKSLQDVLQITHTYNQDREAIDLKYFKLREALEKNATNMTKQEYDKRTQALNDAKADEIKILDESTINQTGIFKKIGESLFLKSKKDLQDLIKGIDKTLEQGFLADDKGNKIIDLTPEMIAKLLSARTQINGMVDDSGKVANIFKNLSGFTRNFNQELGDALDLLGNMVTAAQSVKDNLKAFKEAKNTKGGDLLGEISSIVGVAGAIGSVVGSVAGMFTKQAQENKRLREEYQQFLTNIYTGEFAINQLYRERELTQVRLNDLRLQGAKQELEILQKQKAEIDKEAQEVLSKLQQQTFTATKDQVLQFIKDNNLNAFEAQKLFINPQLSLAGKTFADLEKLDAFGQLSGTAKTLFDTLKKLKDEGVDVEKQMQDLQKQIAVDLTGGATKESIADSIAEGFAQGKRSAADFADTFKDLMQKAALAALKLRFLDEPLKKFIDEFQADVQSGDKLDDSEVAKLHDFWNNIITNASKAMDQIQQVAGIDFNSITGGNANSLQGSIKTISEESASLLAGQFGGLRLTAIQQLNTAMQQLDRLNAIQTNTLNTVNRIEKLESTMVDFFQTKGVKIA